MAIATLPTQLTGDYTIDTAHSHIGFTARHAMVTKVRGAFGEFRGQGHFDAEDPRQSNLELVIDVESVDTRNADRDAHLRTNDFFDMEKYPQITFRSTSVERQGPTTFQVTGDLTIKDVTRSVTFDLEYTGSATDPMGNDRMGLEGSTTVNRKDYGMGFNVALEAGGVLVSEKVVLEFDVSAIKTPAS